MSSSFSSVSEWSANWRERPGLRGSSSLGAALVGRRTRGLECDAKDNWLVSIYLLPSSVTTTKKN